MAFSSIASSAVWSHAPIFPEKLSQIGKPNVTVRGSFATNYHKESLTIDNDNVVNSNLLKNLNYPIDHRSFIDDIHVDHVRKLKAFKHIISRLGEDSFEGFAIIDAVQRLGIEHHFQDEIQQIMRRQYMMSSTYNFQNHDLQEIALRFRLLRQEGYNVPADMFNKFTNKDGKFNLKISEDINGLMALYEASQVRIGGEDVLDEAEIFSAKLLNESLKHLDHDQAKIVRTILSFPFHKSSARFMAKNFYLSNFQGENLWMHALRELAKMDFNLVQSLHQKETVQISKWWKDVGLAKKLEFARDQPLKWYIWSMACLTDASLSWQRIELTKPVSLIYIIDDIFDVYGTLEELTIFTETVNSWDHGATDRLPHYMRICFEALDNITNEISYKVHKKHGYNPLQSLRKAWSSLFDAFLIEAKWFVSGHIPKAEDYLKNGIVSSGVHVVLVHIFYLLGHNITSETVELIDNNPGIISSTATILRLSDDMGSAKDENQDGKDGSYVYYYMREHPDASEEDVEKHVINKISEAWKHLNKECLSPNPFSSSFTKASLNLARMVPLMYSYDDNQRLPGLEEYIKSLLSENEPTRGVY